MSEEIRRFVLVRIVDETGVSGTGVVAWGTCFPDGVSVLRWNTERSSTAVYQNIEDLQEIHGHNGKTKVLWIDELSDEG